MSEERRSREKVESGSNPKKIKADWMTSKTWASWNGEFRVGRQREGKNWIGRQGLEVRIC